MPMTAGPGVFGLHENANIACALAETFVIFDTVLLMEVSASCLSNFCMIISAQERQELALDRLPSLVKTRGPPAACCLASCLFDNKFV